MVAKLMELANTLFRYRGTAVAGTAAWDEAVRLLLLMLAPAAPHIAEELWSRRLAAAGAPWSSIHTESWPAVDPSAVVESTREIPVQVNGKLRDKVVVAADATTADIEAAVLARDRIRAILDGRRPGPDRRRRRRQAGEPRRPMTEPIRLGANCWNQYTTWPDLLAAGRRADELGYDSLWTWDHLYPIVGSSDGPMFEAWLMLAAWAQATERVRIGLMVGANTFRDAGADGQDGDDARPHLGRAGDPRHRRRVVRGGARRVRHPVRQRPAGAAALARRGAADHARDARRRAAQRDRPALRGQGGPQRSAADPGRASRCSSAAVASRSRSSSSPDTPTPTTSAAASTTSGARRRSCSSTATPSGATRPRSSGRPGSAPWSSATRAPRRNASTLDLRAQRPR